MAALSHSWEHETDNAQTLTAALAEADDAVQAAATGVEDFQESATAVTDRIDQADKLYREIADGRLLELGNVSGEIDALLGLLGRLDKQGRFEDELRLMRSLNRLLVLGLRWYDLVRSLRRLLHSAEAAGHRAAQAWTHHELGSLYLCAGDPANASTHLDQALRIEEQLFDIAGRCATRHNLDCARRDGTVGGGGVRPHPRPRVLRLVGLAIAAAIVAAGAGTGIALGIRGHRRHPEPPPVRSVKPTRPTISGTPTSGETLTADRGRWKGAQSFEYQWLRCDSGGATCTEITDATETTYQLSSIDVQHTIRVRVTGSNARGNQARAVSLPTAAVGSPPAAPINQTPPSITAQGVGTRTPKYTANPGVWIGNPPPSYRYQWYTCNGSTGVASCSAIGGATSADYAPPATAKICDLRVRVTASNDAGSNSAASKIYDCNA
jgi:hypothetical protein